MGDALFYHLTQSGVLDTLRLLLPKALAAGWRVELRGPSRDVMARLDRDLWLGPEDGFLPHGMAGGDHDADQPVILTWPEQGAQAVDCVMAVLGAEVTAEEAAKLSRLCVLFDGHDDAALSHARGQWRLMTGAGVTAQYWAQEGQGWQKKAES